MVTIMGLFYIYFLVYINRSSVLNFSLTKYSICKKKTIIEPWCRLHSSFSLYCRWALVRINKLDYRLVQTCII